MTMKMHHKLFSILILAGLLVGQSTFAVSEVEEGNTEDVQATRVPIDGIVLSRCGSQEIYFSGSIISSTPTEYLVVELDNVVIPHTLNGNLWITDLVPIDVGTHKVKSELIETDTISNPFNPFNSHQRTFAVQPCPTPDPTPTATPIPTPTPTQSSNGGGGGGDNGGGGGGSDGGGSSEESQPAPKPKTGKVLGVSTVDRSASDFIPNHLVPAAVQHIFAGVFGRTITHAESAYWKSRARSDKSTESKLRGAMAWHKAHGSTGVKQSMVGKAKAVIGSLVPRINAIFRSVYDRNPSPSENRYWLTRIADKVTEIALRGAMLFHKQQGITH